MKKFILITLAIIIVLIVTALAAPYFLKDKIINAVKTAANDNLNATFDFKDLDISLIRNFPSVYVALIDVSIVGKDEFKNDTLAAISLLSVKADFWKLIASGTTQIKYIGISQPRIHLIALKNGKVNWDIAKSSESSSKKEESSED